MNSKKKKKREAMKKMLKVAENNHLRQPKFHDDRKPRMLSLNENSRKMITGVTQIRPGGPTKAVT